MTKRGFAPIAGALVAIALIAGVIGPIGMPRPAIAGPPATHASSTIGGRTAAQPAPDATAEATPAATLQLTAEECRQYADFHRAEQERFAALQVAINEAGLGIAASIRGLDTVDLDPAIARELAALTDAAAAQHRAVAADVPPFYQGIYDAFLAYFAAEAAALRAYADAVEAGANPDEALAARYNDPELAAIAGEAGKILGVVDACSPGPAEEAASSRELAALAEAAAQALTTVETPPVAQAANDALVDFLVAGAAEERAFADRIEAGEDPAQAGVGPATEVTPLALAADELIRDLLERCGIPVGVTEPDDGVPPLTAAECEQVFAWYEATEKHLAELNAVLREDLRNLGEAGIALPGNLGSVDLDTVLGQQTAATPEAGATPAATPGATPQISAEACAEVRAWTADTDAEGLVKLQIALNEAGVGAGTGEFDPSAVDLDPVVARELAAMIDATLAEEAGVEVPDAVRAPTAALIAMFDTFGTLLIEYAIAVEGGTDPDEAMAALYADFSMAFAELETTYLEPLAVLNEACGLHLTAEAARDLAAAADAAAQSQAAADVPEVAQEADEALRAVLAAFSAAHTDYAAAVEAGTAPEAARQAAIVAVAPKGLAADELLGGLLERCGIPVGVTEAEDGIPALSDEGCADVFAWYAATAARLADFNASLRAHLYDFTEISVALPGGSGSVDLDAVHGGEPDN